VLSVVLAHAAETTTGPLAVFLGHIGSRGVDLFFVLSGCCLAYPLLGSKPGAKRSFPSPAAFLRRRLSRIAPPYYAALMAFGFLAFTPFGQPSTPFPANASAILRQFGLDAAFLPNMHPVLNADFWTLGFEMRWYLVFPLALALYVRSRVGFGLAMVASALLFHWQPSIPDFGLLPCFMFGIVAADIALRKPGWSRAVWPACVVLLGIQIVSEWLQPAIVDHADPLWQFAMFLIVVGVMGSKRAAKLFSFRAFELIGIASYSIYLVHHPVVASLARAGVTLWLAVPVAIAVGFAFWYFVERPLVRREVRRAVEAALRLPFLFRSRARAAEEPVVRVVG
jgi:peptidoglycan/LPS O-acetylase OafA/YrhL